MHLYRSIPRWVDKVLSDMVQARLLVLVGVLPLFGVPLIGNWWWIPPGLFLAVWVAFVSWRAWRLFKTGIVDSEKSDWVEPK